MAYLVRHIALPLCGAVLLATSAVAAAQSEMLDSEQAEAVCGERRHEETCGPGNGRRTPGGGEKVRHKGWPAVTGILWQVRHNRGSSMVGSSLHDESL